MHPGGRARRWRLSIGCWALLSCSEIRAAREDDASAAASAQESDDDAGYRACGSFVLVGGPDNATPVTPPFALAASGARDGAALDPPLMTTTTGGDRWCLHVPGGQGALDLHFHPLAAGHLLDTVLLRVRSDSRDDSPVRVYYAEHLALRAQFAEYDQRADRAPLMGTLLELRQGVAVAAIGCATVHIDDQPHPSEQYAQRYIDGKGLEALPSQLAQTNSDRGAFLFGNLTKGRHTIKVSFDRGKTFVAETSIYVGLVRADVEAPSTGVVYQLAIELEGVQTPAGCEQL